MMAVSKERHEKFSKCFIGKTLNGVLFETNHETGFENLVVGHARNYMRVITKLPAAKGGLDRSNASAFFNSTGNVRVGSVGAFPAQDFTLEADLIL